AKLFPTPETLLLVASCFRRRRFLVSSIGVDRPRFIAGGVSGRIFGDGFRRLSLAVLALTRGIFGIIVADDIRSAATVLPIVGEVSRVDPRMRLVAVLPGIVQRLAGDDIVPVRRA